ncbi:hypothetical protein D3C85_1553240 [compost metagenome]
MPYEVPTVMCCRDCIDFLVQILDLGIQANHCRIDFGQGAVAEHVWSEHLRRLRSIHQKGFIEWADQSVNKNYAG